MRLRQLKISGFKSFADTTLIDFPSSLTGIVGPNGCGKSNVIDAIRWVLGEGRISELRGSSSMSELIFSGAASRPAGSRASVEMVLDNSDHTVLGPWGSYTELSIKRVVTRDGSNAYLINNQQVRRRDVQDIFLGTGLGPRSYAIISQGMISNFIKAKPEELRVYLEEAAGVSKYKERRRETETALNTTRDNLQKVAYLQDNKRQEIERLSAEAETAKRWRELEDKRVRASLLVDFVQETEMRDNIDKINAKVAKLEADLLTEQGESQRLQIHIEELKEACRLRREETDAAMQNKFEAEKRVTEMQGNIRHIIETKDALTQQVASDKANLVNRQAEKQQALDQAEELAKNAASTLEAADLADAQIETFHENLATLQNAYDDAHICYESARKNTTDTQNRIEIFTVQLQAFSRELTDLEERLNNLRAEAKRTDVPDPKRFEELTQEVAKAEEDLDRANASLKSLQEKRTATETTHNQASGELTTASHALATARARLQTLESIEEKAANEGKLPKWLDKMGFSKSKRLFEQIEVKEPWAVALEAVLNVRANAIGLGNLESASGFTFDPPPSRMFFYDASGKETKQTPATGTFSPLSDFVTSSDQRVKSALSHWLANVYVAKDLEEALKNRTKLPDNASFVTQEGHIVDVMSVAFWSEENENAGRISRLNTIKTLQAQMTDLVESVDRLTEQERFSKAEMEQAAIDLNNAQNSVDAIKNRLHQTQIERTSLEAQLKAYTLRQQQVNEDIAALEARSEQIEGQRDEVEAKFDTLDEELSQKQQAQTEAQLALEEAENRVSNAQKDYNDKVSAVKLSRLQAQNLLERSKDAAQRAEREQSEIERIEHDIADREEALKGLDVQAQNEGLTALTNALENARAQLLAAESATNAAENTLEEAHQRYNKILEDLAPHTQKIGDLKTQRQTWLTQIESLTLRLDEAHVDREALTRECTEQEYKLPGLKGNLTKLVDQIAALGPINHAALENLEHCKNAMQETEKQVADLEAAIENLEETIHKIDAETRELLRHTFDEVNRNFGEMFTSLFGGGSAELRMDGEEILDTGIEVLAQPPGKRNSNVKVLSGGEQALTATALVFAIFRLNPAPFCLLDEVDAPLDEANQDRLAHRIVQMSESTQFVMITHHRVSMEQLKQLVGVTMKEPGVSRVVAVDIAQASQMAEGSVSPRSRSVK